MTKSEQLDDVRRQLREARQAQDAADQAFAAADALMHAAKVATLERYEAALLPDVEREIYDEAAKQARQRLQKLHNAVGSHATSYANDLADVEAAHAALAKAVAKYNERFATLEMCHREFEALTHRFGPHDVSELPPLPAPPSALYRTLDLPRLNDHSSKFAQWETDPDSLRKRRTYKECEATKAFEIIMRAGLVPFDPAHPYVIDANARRRANMERMAHEGGAAGLAATVAVPLVAPAPASKAATSGLNLGEVTDDEIAAEKARGG